MRFCDTNPIIYSILTPKRKLNRKEREIKQNAKEIFQRINRGEDVAISTVHIGEIANILEDAINLTFSVDFLKDFISKPNIHILPVSYEDYVLAIAISKKVQVSINDALAYVIMSQEGITEIYSYDKHFDNLDVTRLES